MQSLHILVVDDHADSAQALANLLRHEGHSVATADTFAGALAQGTTAPLDVLVCDVDLPDGDGCELLRRLQSFRGGRELAAVAVAGFGNEWLEVCRMAGYRKFLTKPVEFANLLEAIESLRPQEPVALGGVPSPSAASTP
jgi:CheY-like chemotaxis protein